MSLWRWIGLAVLVGCSVFFTWKVGAWRYGKQLADLNVSYQADLTAISNAAAAQARQALERQQSIQKALAELDAKATTEKTRDLAENERLRADVAVGDRRLRIAGRYSADSSNLSNTASTSRLDDGGTAKNQNNTPSYRDIPGFTIDVVHRIGVSWRPGFVDVIYDGKVVLTFGNANSLILDLSTYNMTALTGRQSTTLYRLFFEDLSLSRRSASEAAAADYASAKGLYS